VLQGIYDFRSTNSLNEQASYFHNWFCNNEAASSGGSVSVLGLGSADADMEFAKSQCGETTIDESSYAKFQEIIRKVNPAVTQAWSDCMKRRGLSAGIIVNPDPHRFTVHLSYVPTSNTTPFATLQSGDSGFLIQGDATCVGDWLIRDRKVRTTHVIACQRRHLSETITITMNADVPFNDGEILNLLPAEPISVVPKNKTFRMGYCRGFGKLDGLQFWGPLGSQCNGPAVNGWGLHESNPQELSELASCLGQGGVGAGFEFWGAEGFPCGVENGAWSTLGDPNVGGRVVDISATGIAACTPKDGPAAGHLVWGPTGQPCAGNAKWGLYDQFVVYPSPN
jgi:hypothetical protein